MATERVRRCRPEIFYGSTDLWRWLQDYLVAFSYSDHVHGKADELELTLEDRDQVWQYIPNPAKGAAILANLVCLDWEYDGQQLVLPCGWFEIDEIEAMGPPSQIRIMAHSAGISKAMTQTRKSRAWENVTLATPARDIAKEHGLELVYQVDDDLSFERIDQTEQADLEFLHRECNRWDLCLKVASNKLVIVASSALEANVSGPGISKDTISRYQIRDKTRDTYRKCKAHYWDPKRRQLHRHVESDNVIVAGDELDINERMDSPAHARKRARKGLDRHNKFEIEGDFTMMGRPDLVAGISIPVHGFGYWSGAHFIEESRHVYTKHSGYQTSIRTRKLRAS